MATGGRRALICALLVGVSVLLTGCSNIDNVGVTPTPSGSGLRIMAARCSGERVQAFELRTFGWNRKRRSVDSRTLWKVVSDRGVRIDSAVVGTTPVGFRESVPFTALPPGHGQLEAVVTSRGQELDAGEIFRIEHLRSGRVRFDGVNLTPDEFRDEFHSEQCSSPFVGTEILQFVLVLDGVGAVGLGAFALLFTAVGALAFANDRRIARRNRARFAALAQAPPGWYLDPSDATRWRWWDGTEWGPRS
jgi:hypothetical protein